MSREDPQFKLRMPPDLREKADRAAKAAGRSLNSELVARIEASFLSNAEAQDLLPAKRARELSLMARSKLPEEIRRRALKAIAVAISYGHDETFVSLDDLNLDVGIPDEEIDAIFSELFTELKSAGYELKHEDISSLWISFK